LLGGARLLYRIYFERQSNFKDYSSKILLIGAGNAGAQLIKDAIVDGRNRIQIVAIFDDNPKTHGRSIQGITVVGPTSLIGEYASDHNVNDVVIAIPSASAQQMRQLVNLCAEFKLRVKTLPAVTDLIEGKVELSNIRPINITDLLARDQIELDAEQVNILISKKVVMVTGAGGSIGSELCAQILRHDPAKLILFETCEFFIYKTERALREKFSHIEIVPVVGDVRDSVRVENTLAKYRPDILFHAAAYKHVPMMELNPEEAIKTNVGGTAIVSSLANKYKVARFVMVSSDKAVNPTNIMGATKRVAEMLCLEQNAKGPTHFTIIRFGNVLGSAGSVIPLFQEQIRNGGPVTVTHPEVTRYFMSIPEATQLVLQACSLGNGGEIFVLEMGKPVKIADLAKDLIRLSGFEPEIDIRIEYTGLRPGEKLYEELLTDNEHTSATSHNLVRRALLQKNPENFNMLLDRLIGSVNEEKHIKNILRELVPEYKIYQNEQGHENSKS
ncbi:MAG: nucleoside-diphosphate sugar epimerase/dehydratase, partial [Bdellovibrionales bacterium]